jgi:hypothetical protein
VTLLAENRNAYRVLVGKLRKRQPEIPWRRWYTIKPDFKYRKWGRDSSGSGQGQVASCCEDDHELSGVNKLRGIS